MPHAVPIRHVMRRAMAPSAAASPIHGGTGRLAGPDAAGGPIPRFERTARPVESLISGSKEHRIVELLVPPNVLLARCRTSEWAIRLGCPSTDGGATFGVSAALARHLGLAPLSGSAPAQSAGLS